MLFLSSFCTLCWAEDVASPPSHKISYFPRTRDSRKSKNALDERSYDEDTMKRPDPDRDNETHQLQRVFTRFALPLSGVPHSFCVRFAPSGSLLLLRLLHEEMIG